MADQAYEQREFKIFRRDVEAPSQLPTQERRENEAKLLEILREDPELVAQRISWLIDGSYGYGSYRQAWQVLDKKRMNRSAWLVQTIGALEWHVVPRRVAHLWHQLTQAQKDALNKAVEKEILEAEEGEHPEFWI